MWGLGSYEFLKEIESWRELLAKNIALRNPEVSIYELNYAVQKIIDRIIFLRICEDRGIEHYGQLQTKAESGDVYTHLRNHFKLAESKYDSGIFDFDTDRITPALRIDDRVLKAIVQSLYYPKSPYEFSVLGVEILGNVYEQFLGKVIRLTAGHQAKVETKLEVKKAGGVYYTPQYIVDYIVKNTVGKLIEGETPEEIVEMKILDPACGSGSFLIGAYTYLLRYHLDWYTNNNPKKHKDAVFQVRENEWYLTTAEKKRILLNNIFGVDIDPQAVEVTKLSLLLNVLENESRESIDQQVKLGLEGVLPNLEDNIKCGNSLIGPDFYGIGQQETLFDEAEMRRVNVFDWNDERKGFGRIMKRGGFDCVVGNPPYVRIQNLDKQQMNYFRGYRTAIGNYDIYCLFVEKGFNLLNQNGVLSFILPHRFFKTDYGEGLRNFLAKNKSLSNIFDFDGFYVFDKASINTCIIKLQKDNFGFDVQYLRVKNPKIEQNNLTNLLSSFISNTGLKTEEDYEVGLVSKKGLQKDYWNFILDNEVRLFNRLNENKKLGELGLKIFVGLQTSADPVFVLRMLCEDGEYFKVQSKHTKKEYLLEKQIFYPLLRGADILPYKEPSYRDILIFPYSLKDGKAVLIDEKTMRKDFPNIWEYLLECKPCLLKRASLNKSIWWCYPYPKNLTLFCKPKIMTTVLSGFNSFTLDDKGIFYFVGGGNAGVYGIQLEDESEYKYILGLLNSKLLNWYHHKISLRCYQTAYSYGKRFIEQLPVPTIDFSNPTEKEQHDKLVALVDNMLELQKKYHDARMERDKELYERQIRIVDTQIDRLVYDLYGLTEEEVKVVVGER
ncbi:MAG: Eco57I restriction-modification methylase domain-containing protein [Halobacteriota archaeon]